MKRKFNLIMACATGFVLAAAMNPLQAQTNGTTGNWDLRGNSNIDPSINFIGTTTNHTVKFKTNNQVRMAISGNGKVAVGSSTGVFKFEVKGGSMSVDSLYRIKGVQVLNRDAANNVQLGDNSALVGIGTAAPATKLDVNGVITATGGNSDNWNTAYSWGDHAAAGYLTSFTETDPEVGANVLNFVPKWNGSALVNSGIFQNGNFYGLGASSTIGAANLVLQSPNASSYGGMYINQTGSALKPFYGYAVNGTSSCWTYYDQSSKTFRLYNSGDRFAVDSLGQVGIGTNSPGYYLDIQASSTFRALNAVSSYVGSVGQIVNFERTSPPSSANDILQITVPAGSPNDFQFIEADVAGSNRFQVNGDGSVGIGISVSTTARLNVDGANAANRKLYGIYATTDSTSSASYAIYGQQTNASSDARGVFGHCSGGDGIGYGVYGQAGYIGVRGFSSAGAYTGSGYGVYGSASGTAGTRIGVYGSASGGTVENWGGYFPTKVYTSEIRVGTTGPATGYIACIGGKLIAEEVRVALEANWPDYVFKSGYKKLSIDELQDYVNEYNHLPGVPSACELEDNGLHLGQMQSKMMEKLEEQALYIMELNNRIKELESMMKALPGK